MKIIKAGVLPETIEVEKTCMKCSTVFSYTKADIQHDFRDHNSYVECPVCKNYIDAQNPAPINLVEAYYNK